MSPESDITSRHDVREFLANIRARREIHKLPITKETASEFAKFVLESTDKVPLHFFRNISSGLQYQSKPEYKDAIAALSQQGKELLKSTPYVLLLASENDQRQQTYEELVAAGFPQAKSIYPIRHAPRDMNTIRNNINNIRYKSSCS
jgi:hypothetical protein